MKTRFNSTLAGLCMLAAALFFCNSSWAQKSLSEAVAAGNNVFVEIEDELAGTDNAFPADERQDVIRTCAEAGGWTVVESADEADFILHMVVKKKYVFNSPRTWLTPSVKLQDGTVLWKGDMVKADATMFNGFKSTNTALKKLFEKEFPKLFKKANRS